MRRTHLRGHDNIRKRLLIHAGGFTLGLVMRQYIGIGKPPAGPVGGCSDCLIAGGYASKHSAASVTCDPPIHRHR